MALIDVVKWEANDRELVHKFPSKDLRIGSQLVVYKGQTAFFIKGGKLCDQFEEGTYTLETHNIPLINKIINIPFGSSSPFQAEVWFVSCISILDTKWGTLTPIQIEDPKYDIIVPVRAFGQYGLRVSNPKLFLETLVSNMSSFTIDKIDSYFKGKILSLLTSLISSAMIKDKVSVIDVNSHVLQLSEYVCEQLKVDFAKYGIELVNFHIVSVNVLENDPSFRKLKAAKDLAARLKITGRDAYQLERSFDVLDKAAENESGGGNLMNMGVGLGAGLGIGHQVSSFTGQIMNPQMLPPPIPQILFYLAINGQQYGPYNQTMVSKMIENKQINSDTLVWRSGLVNWVKISSLEEFALLFSHIPPISK